MCALLFQVLDSNGITHMCTHTAAVRLSAAHISAGQGQILLLSADLHHHAKDKNLKPERLSGKRKIRSKPDSPPLPHSPCSFPTSVVTRAACRKVCSFGSLEHCCTPGVKMRKHFDFGDLWPSSCRIRGAHHCSQPFPLLQLSAHFFSGSRVVLYLGNYNY